MSSSTSADKDAISVTVSSLRPRSQGRVCLVRLALVVLCNLSLTRTTLGNIMGTAFPLFTTQLFAKLTYHWGSTLFGCLAVLMIPIPYVRHIPSLAAASSADHDRPSLLCDAYRADRSCCGRDPRSGRGASSHRKLCIHLPHTSSGSGGRSDMFHTGFLCERELQAHRRLATLFTPLHLRIP